MVSSGQIILSYGLDASSVNASESVTSNDIFFFSGNNKNGYSFSSTFTPRNFQAKVETYSPVVPKPEETPYHDPLQHVSSTVRALSAGASFTSTVPSAQSESDTTPKPGVLVASAIGGLFAFALVGGAIALYFKRKATEAALQETMKQDDAATQDGVPPVSALLFTRPAVKRSMSLGGSTIDSTFDEKEEQDYQAEHNSAGFGAENVPMSSPASITSIGASVTSYPFLKAVPMGQRTHSASTLDSISSSNSSDTAKPERSLLDYIWPSVSRSPTIRSPTLNEPSSKSEPDPYTMMSSGMARSLSARSRASVTNKVKLKSTPVIPEAIPICLHPSTPVLNDQGGGLRVMNKS